MRGCSRAENSSSSYSRNQHEQTTTAVWQVSLDHNSNNGSKLTNFYREKAAPVRPRSPVKRKALRHSQSMPTWTYDPVVAEQFRATGLLDDPRAYGSRIENSPFLDMSVEPPYASLLTRNGRREAPRTTYGEASNWEGQATATNRAGGHMKGARLTARELGKLILTAEDKGVPNQNPYRDTRRVAPHWQGHVQHPFAHQEPEYQRSVPRTMPADDQILSMWKGKGKADPDYEPPKAPPYPPEMQQWLATYGYKNVTPKPSLSSVRQRTVSTKSTNPASHPDSLKPANGRLHHSRSQPRMKSVRARQPEIVDPPHRTSFKAVVSMAPVPPVPPLPNMGPHHPIARGTRGKPVGPRPLPPIPRK